jgi:hypothetical protein
MNGIKDAMAGQRHNDDPRARLEPGNGRSREQGHHHRLDDHRLNRAAHHREQHVVQRNHNHHSRIEGPVAIESHLPRKQRDARRQHDSDDEWQQHVLELLVVTISRGRSRRALSVLRLACACVLAALAVARRPVGMFGANERSWKMSGGGPESTPRYADVELFDRVRVRGNRGPPSRLRRFGATGRQPCRRPGGPV